MEMRSSSGVALLALYSFVRFFLFDLLFGGLEALRPSNGRFQSQEFEQVMVLMKINIKEFRISQVEYFGLSNLYTIDPLPKTPRTPLTTATDLAGQVTPTR